MEKVCTFCHGTGIVPVSSSQDWGAFQYVPCVACGVGASPSKNVTNVVNSLDEGELLMVNDNLPSVALSAALQVKDYSDNWTTERAASDVVQVAEIFLVWLRSKNES